MLLLLLAFGKGDILPKHKIFTHFIIITPILFENNVSYGLLIFFFFKFCNKIDLFHFTNTFLLLLQHFVRCNLILLISWIKELFFRSEFVTFQILSKQKSHKETLSTLRRIFTFSSEFLINYNLKSTVEDVGKNDVEFVFRSFVCLCCFTNLKLRQRLFRAQKII